MDRPTYRFKIGQRVFHRAKGRPGRTGPFTIVGLVRQSDGATLYRLKNKAEECTAREDELKLYLGKSVLSE